MKFIAKGQIRGIAIFAIVLISATLAFGQRNELSGTKWVLTHVNGQNIGMTNAFLEVGENEKRFSGNAGCNRMFGQVDVSGTHVDFGNVGLTKMACIDPKTNRLERNFTNALGNADRFRISGNTLELLDRRRTVLKFKSERKAETKLESRKWVVEQIGGRDVRVKGTMPFVNFDATKSSAGGDTGCNAFGGSYAVAASTIRIFDTISTMRACIEDKRTQVERQFMDVLQNADRFEIKGDKLFLYKKERLLALFRGENK